MTASWHHSITMSIAACIVACGNYNSSEGPLASAHGVVGAWALRPIAGRSGIRLEVRVDSVARDSAYGALTFYMAGNTGFLTPEDWGPLRGTVRADSVRLVVASGARAPEIGLHGVMGRDTVRVATVWIGPDTLPGPMLLVRPTASTP